MRPSRSIVITILLLLVALAVASWFIGRRRDDRRARLVFPDGTRVRVLGAVRGGTSFTNDEFWARPLRKILPSRWQGWLPVAATLVCGGNTNELVVFFAIDAMGVPTPWTWLAAVDEDGFRYPHSGGSCSSTVNGKRFVGVTVRGFPRREKSFRVDFLDQNHVPIAHTRVPNPFPLAPRQTRWQAQSLPATVTNGELALTLVSAREMTNQWGSQLLPKWQTHTLDPQWQAAEIGYLQTADESGNEGGFLSRQEPVWRVNATFHRKRPADFAAHEKMTVTNLTLAAAGEMMPLEVGGDCAGVRIQLEGMFGRGTLFITNGLQRAMSSNIQSGWSTFSDGKTTIESIGSAHPFFLLNATGLAGNDELRLRLTDDQGRDIPLESPSSWQFRNRRTRVYQRGFKITNDVSSLSLEIIVSHPKEFEFYINPAAIQPPQPRTK